MEKTFYDSDTCKITETIYIAWSRAGDRCSATLVTLAAALTLFTLTLMTEHAN